MGRRRRNPWLVCSGLVVVLMMSERAELGAQELNAAAVARPTLESVALQETGQGGRFGAYVNDMIGPWALIGIVARAGFDQIQEEPEEWPDNSEGFGKRVASNAGRRFAQETVHHGLALALNRSTRYQPCDCSGIGPKIGHALREAVTDRGPDGSRMFSVAQIAGNYAGAFAELAWKPDPDAGKAAINGTTAILFTAAGNFLVKELIGFGR